MGSVPIKTVCLLSLKFCLSTPKEREQDAGWSKYTTLETWSGLFQVRPTAPIDRLQRASKATLVLRGLGTGARSMLLLVAEGACCCPSGVAAPCYLCPALRCILCGPVPFRKPCSHKLSLLHLLRRSFCMMPGGCFDRGMCSVVLLVDVRALAARVAHRVTVRRLLVPRPALHPLPDRPF